MSGLSEDRYSLNLPISDCIWLPVLFSNHHNTINGWTRPRSSELPGRRSDEIRCTSLIVFWNEFNHTFNSINSFRVGTTYLCSGSNRALVQSLIVQARREFPWRLMLFRSPWFSLRCWLSSSVILLSYEAHLLFSSRSVRSMWVAWL